MKSCGTCRFGAPDEGTADIVCRRFPPAVIDVLDGTDYLWPVLAATEWCGEWKAATD